MWSRILTVWVIALPVIFTLSLIYALLNTGTLDTYQTTYVLGAVFTGLGVAAPLAVLRVIAAERTRKEREE